MSFEGEYSGARIKSVKVYAITKKEHPKLFRFADGNSSVKSVIEMMKLDYPLKTGPTYSGGGGASTPSVSDGRIFREGNNEDCVVLKQRDENRIELFIIKGENLRNLSDIGIATGTGNLRAMSTILQSIQLDSHAKEDS